MASEVLKQPIEVFYAGKHVDSSGKKIEIKPAQLAGMVANFNQSGRRVPLVPGHPSDNIPALGYATRMESIGGRAVIVAVEDLDPAFKAIVNSGELNRVSLKLHLPGHRDNLHGKFPAIAHIGFLGRSRPALELLRSASFSKQDKEVYLMADDMDDDMDYGIDRRAAEFAAKQAEFAAREAALVAKEAAFAKARLHEPWIEELVRAGKILPAQKSGCIALFSALPDAEEYEFAAGEKQSVLDFAKGLLQSLPKQVEYGEFSQSTQTPPHESAFKSFDNSSVDGEALDVHTQILASGVDPSDHLAYQNALRKARAGA
jgi:hypothetical protein